MKYYNNYDNREFDWDDEIENDSYYLLFESGDYNFKVLGYEKKVSQNGNNMIVLDLEVYDGRKKTHVTDYLTLTEKAKWKLANFFSSIGLRKRGENVKLDWANAIGRTGLCTLEQKDNTSYKTGREYKSNIIKNYLTPVDW